MNITTLFGTSTRNFIVDPLTVIVKLATLAFMPDGTKIGFTDGDLVFQDPSIMQGAVRFANGDRRSDIHNLLLPIYYACVWYSEKQSMKNIFTSAVGGLNKLKTIYRDNPIINQCLHYYIIIIESYINKKGEADIDAIDTDISDGFSGFKNLWSEKEISIISTLFDYLTEQTKRDRTQQIHQCLEQFLKVK